MDHTQLPLGRGRIGGKAGVGAGVSAIQSGGNPYAIGTGAVLGGAGEAVGPLLSKFNTLSKAPATPQNFSRAFEATTLQNKVISKAFDTLKEDGQKVPASLADAHAMAKNKLEELGQAYASLPADYEAKTMPVNDVIAKLSIEAGERSCFVSSKSARGLRTN